MSAATVARLLLRRPDVTDDYVIMNGKDDIAPLADDLVQNLGTLARAEANFVKAEAIRGLLRFRKLAIAVGIGAVSLNISLMTCLVAAFSVDQKRMTIGFSLAAGLFLVAAVCVVIAIRFNPKRVVEQTKDNVEHDLTKIKDEVT